MKPILEKIVNILQDKKATGDVILNKSKSLKLSSQNAQINEYKVSSSQIVGVRLIKDDRIGISYSESFDDESLKMMVNQALENSYLSEPKPEEKILEGRGEIVDIADYQESEVSIETKIEKALELESLVKSLEPRTVAVPWNGYTESEVESYLLNTSERSTTYRDKTYSITSSALLEENGVKANHYDFHMAHRYAELDFKKVVGEALFHARHILKEEKIKTGKYAVHFAPDCLQSLFICFSNFYSAQANIDKTNPWSEKLNQEVISKDLTITDHPLMPQAFRASLFDDEGVERKPLKLVEQGILQNFYHNTYTARKFGVKTTGHASRGPASSLGISGTMLVVEGKRPQTMPTKYLEIIRMDGLYSGANRMLGTFSVGIKGYLWENGERKLTVGNVTLSGNMMEMFKNVIVAGDQLISSPDQNFFSVPLIFNDLSIAGI